MRATRLGEPSRPRAASTSTRSGRRLETAVKASSADEQRPITWWTSSRENNASSASLNNGCESASSTRAMTILSSERALASLPPPTVADPPVAALVQP